MKKLSQLRADCHVFENKKGRLGNLSMTWIVRVGAIGFEPATYCSQSNCSLHLEWLEIHRNIQPHELQKRYLLLRLKSLTGEYSGIENICSWKRRKKLKVSKSDLEIHNPSLVKNYLVNSQPVLKFNLNDFRPYKF